MSRRRTVALATLGGMAALVALAPAASAHVTASSVDAMQGGYSVVTFRMPNEEAAANTTKLQVQLPTATPLAFAATQPIAGWTAVQTKTKLATPIKTDDGDITEAVTKITWTASSSAAVKPGEFQEFDVQMGPLPKTSSISFPAIQTYSNGDVVRWVEKQAPGSSEEPDHPAPTLQLAAAASSSADHQSSGETATATATRVETKSSSNTGPIVLSIIALVLAAGALGVGVVNRARRTS